ncbi:MAG: DUF2851 family protein, partial [Bacteroidales bacterium]|nr:DUF2851 family protein [Bacteroidales bacterium]
MSEEFLHYIWQYRLFNNDVIKLSDGKIANIIDVGSHNTDAGPDFFNAKIKIGKTVWAGNVEVHIKASDWFKHNHQKNKAYDNVILHVVKENDTIVKNTQDREIPTIEIDFDNNLFLIYSDLVRSKLWIPCQNDLRLLDNFTINHWLSNLTIERLEEKSNKIEEILAKNKNNWEETFYQSIAKSFGLKVNAEPFEMLARSIPLIYLAKHKNSLFQLEALLFGQAGFLYDEELGDEYYESLKKEYYFLKRKFKLKALEKHLWKFLRLRPGNFPTIRIAQFAGLIYQSSALFSKIIEIKDVKELRKILNSKHSEYWERHYVFNKLSVNRKKNLGDLFINSIMINTIIPFLF